MVLLDSSRAALTTSEAEIARSPGSAALVCDKEVLLAGLRKTMLFVPQGPLRTGSVGPKIATTGTCNAAARCNGPVSPPINNRARRVSAMSSETEHEMGCALPPLAV